MKLCFAALSYVHSKEDCTVAKDFRVSLSVEDAIIAAMNVTGPAVSDGHGGLVPSPYGKTSDVPAENCNEDESTIHCGTGISTVAYSHLFCDNANNR